MVRRLHHTADEVPIGSTQDPDERTVELWPSDLEYIHAKPGRATLNPSDLLETVRQPDFRFPGNKPGRVEYVKSKLGPSKWLTVIVDHSAARSFILTAFPRNRRRKS